MLEHRTSRALQLSLTTRRLLLAVCCAVGIASLPAAAADITWDGGDPPNWNVGDNWSGDPDNTVPTSADVARIANNSSAAPALLNDAQQVSQVHVGLTNNAGYLRVETGANLSVVASGENNGLHVGTGSGTGHITQTGGDILVTGGIKIGQGSNSTGTYEISGGTLETSNPIWLGAAGNSTGTVIQTSGTVTAWNNNDSLRIGASNTSLGIYSIGGGVLDVGRRLNLGSGTGTAVMTVFGAADVNVGARSEGHLSIGDGDRLTIDGSKIGIGADDMNVHGHLVMISGSTLEFLVDTVAIADPAAMRKLILTRDLNVQSGSILKVGFADGATPTAGTWELVTWDRNELATAIGLAPSSVSVGWSMNIDTDANAITVSYVPEPASLSVVGLGVLALAARRRR